MNGAKLKTEKTTDIPVHHLKDGQLAVITSWREPSSNKGDIVQRYEDVLITIGKDNNKSYLSVFNYDIEDCRVRVLEPGELIEVQ